MLHKIFKLKRMEAGIEIKRKKAGKQPIRNSFHAPPVLATVSSNTCINKALYSSYVYK